MLRARKIHKEHKIIKSYGNSPISSFFSLFSVPPLASLFVPFVLTCFYARRASISIILFSCAYCSWQINCPTIRRRSYRCWSATTAVAIVVDMFSVNTLRLHVRSKCTCSMEEDMKAYEYAYRLLLLGKLIFICMKLTIYRCVWPLRKRKDHRTGLALSASPTLVLVSFRMPPSPSPSSSTSLHPVERSMISRARFWSSTTALGYRGLPNAANNTQYSRKCIEWNQIEMTNCDFMQYKYEFRELFSADQIGSMCEW